MTLAHMKVESAQRAPSGMGENLISVRNVHKKFCKDLKRSMWYGITDLAKNLAGIRPHSAVLRQDEFWALEDVSFDLRRGEVLGVAGMNGSGKSTLLRLIAGILPPDRGEIWVKGRVASLISLGAGFHPLMTGRENIYLKGTMLKMSRRSIDAKLQSIIDFAEVGDFIDAPVGTYSSGMRIRLGFSIVMAIEPDVLLLDEVLAVGDRNFRAKCFKKIDELSKKSAIILVSHSLEKITRISTGVMILDQGRKVIQTADLSAGIERYHSLCKSEDAGSVTGTGSARVLGVGFLPGGGRGQENGMFKVGHLEDLEFEITFSLDTGISTARMDIIFSDSDHNNVSHCRSNICGFDIRNAAPVMKVRVKFPKLQLSPRLYFITVLVRDERGVVLVRHHAVSRFLVTGNFSTTSAFHLQADWSHVSDDTQD